MATCTRPRFSKEPDPFALDPSSEEFFATGDRAMPAIEKIELDLEEEDTEVARRSAPEVVMRRRRYRRVVSRVVCGVGVVAVAALGKSALSPANASAFRSPPVAVAQLPVRVMEPPEETVKAEPALQAPPTEVAAAPPAEPPTAASEPVAKVVHRAPKKDDDFSDLDIKIEVPKIDVSLE